MYDKFDWDDHNLLHTTRHGISPDESEECFYNEHLVIRKPHSEKIHGETRFYLLGKTNGNKRLFIVFKKLFDDCVRIISVRTMTKAEEKKYGK